MEAPYEIADTSGIITPALVLYRDLIDANLAEMIRIAGSPTRLRPHAKTHKLREVTRMETALGISKHKCATIAEAEMLADAGVEDIFLAYPIVGPNIGRIVRFGEVFPRVHLAVAGDHPRPIADLGAALAAAGRTVDMVLDLDLGMHRTGLPIGDAAAELYRQIAHTPGLRPGGLHLYDGHNAQSDLSERRAAVDALWRQAITFRDQLLARDLPVPRIVAGGTGSFPIYAGYSEPTLELSPGTIVFHDAGYRRMFPDLHFTPAAAVLTRVISRPTPTRVTCDLGYKAIASDPPAGQRLTLPALPDAECVLQNEEHLVIETSRANEFQPGDELLAIPRHICPTSALHQQAYVVSGGEVREVWKVAARDRILSI